MTKKSAKGRAGGIDQARTVCVVGVASTRAAHWQLLCRAPAAVQQLEGLTVLTKPGAAWTTRMLKGASSSLGVR